MIVLKLSNVDLSRPGWLAGQAAHAENSIELRLGLFRNRAKF